MGVAWAWWIRKSFLKGGGIKAKPEVSLSLTEQGEDVSYPSKECGLWSETRVSLNIFQLKSSFNKIVPFSCASHAERFGSEHVK